MSRPTATTHCGTAVSVSAATAPSGPARLRLIVMLGALTALGPFTVDMYLSAFPVIATEFAVSETAVQFTLTGTLVGFAVGQLVIGPMSDALGRRRPLIVASLLHVAASLGCVVAPGIEVLGVLRIVQGFGGAAGAVLAMAVVRDLYQGNAAAVMMSRLMLVMGVAPILAPSVGGLVVEVSTWRFIFVILAALGLSAVALGVFAMPETLAPAARQQNGARTVLRNYARLGSDRAFVSMVVVCGMGRVVMFSYISASPFVLQGSFGLTPQQFGIAFAAGAVVLIGSSQLNVVALRRWPTRTVLLSALLIGTVVAVVFVILSATGTGGLAGFAVPVLLILAVMGSVLPNAPAQALAGYGFVAGTASALIGGVQFAFAAAAAPVVGVLGNDALAVASMMAFAASTALVLVLVGTRPSARTGERDAVVAGDAPVSEARAVTVSQKNIDAAAERLMHAASSGEPCEPVRDLIGRDDVTAAYAVQEILNTERLNSGSTVVGRKIGLTSKAVQAQLGVDRPDFGMLFDDMAYSADAVMAVERVLQPRVEAEIAFVLRDDLADGPFDADRVRRATDYVVAALEVCGSRIRNWDISFADTVADNASAGAYVLGNRTVPIADLDLTEVSMTMSIDGTQVSEGTGAACLGDPVVAVVWLAQTASALGRPLRAGQVVLSGALGPMREVAAGQSVTATLTGLGSVSASFQ
ncbi:Bcr/CflA family efflux MFS transporter [Rhodococcoides trifolii]|uniref:Bcr/CflA family efflux MFS transporter n=1 Tax=Rhodococcoides trifolii TaxID=908250 RepID=UPI00166C146F|nr:Bcr/CflA family efflux MFS transporter [Rhodococcus trifolii]